MKKRKFGTIIAIVLLCALLAGCGKKNENLEKGMQAIAQLDYAQALSDFAAAESAGEQKRLVARGKGIAYMGLTQYEEALACFREALQLSDGWVQPLDYDLNYYLAAASAKCGLYEDADEIYNAILAMRPQETDAYFLRGNVRLALSEKEAAIEDFDKVQSMTPEDYDRLIQIYEVLANYGYFTEGKEYLYAALGVTSPQEDGQGKIDASSYEKSSSFAKMSDYDKGRIFYYLEDYEKAYTYLEEASKKGGALASLYLGRSYEATGDYNYAANVYQAYLAKDTQNAEVYNQLGLCEMTRKNYDKALEAFEAGLNLNDSAMQQSLSFNEVVAYEYLGDFRKAAVLMEAYLKNYPDDEKAKREYDFLSTR